MSPLRGVDGRFVLPLAVSLLALSGCGTPPSGTGYDPNAPIPAPVTTGVPATSGPDTPVTVADDWLMMEITAAEGKARRLGVPFRIVAENGLEFPVTQDSQANRVNVTVENGTIVDVRFG